MSGTKPESHSWTVHGTFAPNYLDSKVRGFRISRVCSSWDAYFESYLNLKPSVTSCKQQEHFVYRKVEHVDHSVILKHGHAANYSVCLQKLSQRKQSGFLTALRSTTDLQQKVYENIITIRRECIDVRTYAVMIMNFRTQQNFRTLWACSNLQTDESWELVPNSEVRHEVLLDART